MYVKMTCSEKVAPVSALHWKDTRKTEKSVCRLFGDTLTGHAAHQVGRCLKLGPHVGIIWAVAGQFQPPFL